MKILKLPIEIVEGFVPQRLAAATGRSALESLGELVWFWAATKRGQVERGTREVLATYMLNGQHAEALVDCLMGVGLLVQENDGIVVIEANRGIADKKLEAIKRAKHARSMVGKKKVTRRRKVDEPTQAQVQPSAIVTIPPEAKTEFQKLCSEAWYAYESGFRARTNQGPLRNAKANSLIVQFVKQVGRESPEVLHFFCTHPSRKYLESVYPLQMAVADAQALHTQWRNKRYVTPEAACQASKSAEFSRRIAELDARISEDDGRPQGSFS